MDNTAAESLCRTLSHYTQPSLRPTTESAILTSLDAVFLSITV